MTMAQASARVSEVRRISLRILTAIGAALGSAVGLEGAMQHGAAFLCPGPDVREVAQALDVAQVADRGIDGGGEIDFEGVFRLRPAREGNDLSQDSALRITRQFLSTRKWLRLSGSAVSRALSAWN